LQQNAEKLTGGITALTTTINNAKASKKLFADEEIAPLYQFRGIFSYDLRDYEVAHEDLTIASKLDPSKITTWLPLSLIRSFQTCNYLSGHLILKY